MEIKYNKIKEYNDISNLIVNLLKLNILDKKYYLFTIINKNEIYKEEEFEFDNIKEIENIKDNQIKIYLNYSNAYLINIFGNVPSYNNKKREKEIFFSLIESKVAGMGVAASRDISKKDGYILEYIGEIIRKGIDDIREKKYAKEGIYSTYFFLLQNSKNKKLSEEKKKLLKEKDKLKKKKETEEILVKIGNIEEKIEFIDEEISEEYIIDATKKGNISRFINHRCCPNLITDLIEINGEEKMLFKVKDDIIKKGTELFFDYCLSSEGTANESKCNCGASECQGFM